MNSAEADRLVAGLVVEDKLRRRHEELQRLQVEARFYLSAEWNEYREVILEPRYRDVTASLVGTDETATMLRAQGEARALRYQIDRAESVGRELEDKKQQYEKVQRQARDAAGV